jgi:hypothetical protein
MYCVLRPLFTRRNFPRGAEFLFVFFKLVPPEKSQDKGKLRSARKIPLSGKRPLGESSAENITIDNNRLNITIKSGLVVKSAFNKITSSARSIFAMT